MRNKDKGPKNKISERKMSLDEYLLFLQDIQKIFKPFEISSRPTITKNNKL